MTEADKIKLSEEWDRLRREMEKAQNCNQVRIAQSFELSMSRIEDKLNRADVDPRDYLTA